MIHFVRKQFEVVSPLGASGDERLKSLSLNGTKKRVGSTRIQFKKTFMSMKNGMHKLTTLAPLISWVHNFTSHRSQHDAMTRLTLMMAINYTHNIVKLLLWCHPYTRNQ